MKGFGLCESRDRVVQLLGGPLRSGEVGISYSDENAFVPSADQQALIQYHWTACLRAAEANARPAYDGCLLRLASFEPHERGVTLHTGPTTYSAYTAAQALAAAGRDRPDPIGTAIIVETADDCVLVGRRSARVAHNPGRYFGFGGLCDPTMDRNTSGHIDLFLSAARELCEESGMDVEPRGLLCVGLFYDLVNPHPELCFSTQLQWTARQCFERMRLEPAEVDSIEAVPIGSLRDFLRRREPQICETFVAELSAYLELRRC